MQSACRVPDAEEFQSAPSKALSYKALASIREYGSQECNVAICNDAPPAQLHSAILGDLAPAVDLGEQNAQGSRLAEKGARIDSEVFGSGLSVAAAIDGDEPLVAAAREAVNRPGETLLAGPARAFDQERAVALGDFREDLEELPHGLAAADDIGERGLRLQFFA